MSNSDNDGSGKTYEIIAFTYDSKGSDPDHPGNSRIVISPDTSDQTSITSGPAMDSRGDEFISVQKGVKGTPGFAKKSWLTGS